MHLLVLPALDTCMPCSMPHTTSNPFFAMLHHATSNPFLPCFLSHATSNPFPAVPHATSKPFAVMLRATFSPFPAMPRPPALVHPPAGWRAAKSSCALGCRPPLLRCRNWVSRATTPQQIWRRVSSSSSQSWLTLLGTRTSCLATLSCACAWQRCVQPHRMIWLSSCCAVPACACIWDKHTQG